MPLGESETGTTTPTAASTTATSTTTATITATATSFLTGSDNTTRNMLGASVGVCVGGPCAVTTTTPPVVRHPYSVAIGLQA